MADFSERVRELRKERGLKQAEMADICGVKVRSYQRNPRPRRSGPSGERRAGVVAPYMSGSPIS